MRTVIAFCGAAGCGKDEAAGVLTTRMGFTKRSFAEALRREVRLAFIDSTYCDSIWPTMPQSCRDAFAWCDSLGNLDPWAKPTTGAMRRLLQLWGTEFRRDSDPQYWIDRERESLPQDGNFVYTDVRFPNEYEMVRSLGGLVFRVERDGVKGNGHVSESYWPTFAHDGAIQNNGTVAEFHDAVRSAITLCLQDSREETLA